jgi:transcriptional regulator of acetoin/glycerol metabolism
MGTLSKANAGIARRTAPVDRRSDPSEDVRLAKAAHEELVLMGMPRVNVLLAGRAPAVQHVLDELTGTLQKPVASWQPGQPLVLPPADNGGTVVIHDVGALRLQEQIRLLEWLPLAAGRTQVISTSAAPLLPRVVAGSFIDTLYYRLNTVYVDVTD